MDSFDQTRREINSSRIFGKRFVQDGCVRRCTGTERSWLRCDLLSGIGESVLLFPGIQMLCCTGPPALGDKWQNSTFHPLPGSYLSAVHGRRAQPHVWMERILYRIRNGGRSDAARLCVSSSQVEIQPPADKLQSANITGSCKIGIVRRGAALTQGPRGVSRCAAPDARRRRRAGFTVLILFVPTTYGGVQQERAIQ